MLGQYVQDCPPDYNPAKYHRLGDYLEDTRAIWGFITTHRAEAMRSIPLLVPKWKDACKAPHAPGKDKPAKHDYIPWPTLSSPANSAGIGGFMALFNQWLKTRGVIELVELTDVLTKGDGVANVLVFNYLPTMRNLSSEDFDVPGASRFSSESYNQDPPEGSVRSVFHGGNFYSLGLILASGLMLPSWSRVCGHTMLGDHSPEQDKKFSGIYTTPDEDAAYGYAHAHYMFGDGIAHKVWFQLIINTRCIKARKNKTAKCKYEQWVLDPDAFGPGPLKGFPTWDVMQCAGWKILRIKIEVNAKVGHDDFFSTWNPELEVIQR